MRAKSQYPFNLKIILICFFFLFLLFLILRSSFSYSQQNSSLNSAIHPANSSDFLEEPKPTDCPTLPNLTPTCTKISPSLAHALVHYATLNITPQQTLKEISVSLNVLEKKSPCNFLVFGLGHDSLMWTALNHGGRTVFLEEDKSWIEQIKRQIPWLESYHVVYNTKVTQADELLDIGMKEECKAVSDPRFSKCQLALKGLPNEVYDIEWDLIMVDAPTGYFDGAPGRMSAIYTAGLMARNRENGETDVFVHDVDRVVEDKFSKALLCEGYLREQEGRIRHFTIPSHRTRLGEVLKNIKRLRGSFAKVGIRKFSDMIRRRNRHLSIQSCKAPVVCYFYLLLPILSRITETEKLKSIPIMAKTKKELLTSAPWRVGPQESDEKFKDARLKVTSQPGTTPTMHVPGKKKFNSKNEDVGEDALTEIDPELRYSFQRNFQFLQRVFSIDTVVKPLPPAMAYNVSRNLTFFTRIFTQFFDPDGIADAQKSLGLGQEEKVRKVR